MHMRSALLFTGLVAGFASFTASAQSKGDWAIAVGAHQVAPKSDNGRLVGGTLEADVGKDIRPTFSAEYFIADNLGIEVLAALPFEHDIALRGVGRVGSTKHLPPVISLQYHFNSQGKLSPFLGAGVNYTRFFSTDTRGALAGSELELDDSWGLALHAGVDFKLSDRGALRVNLRWIDIDTDARLNGNRIGTVNIDPLVYGAAYVYRF
ncbi:OmpW family protein [Xanthomonas melonis]|uniref:OmpW family protein n=1 Tax=Xanthomonas melonis TaxID=56456 RepID=A0A2S7DI31_9XANT|nr:MULTISPECIES: OmpW family outer membrane protein [Xanthomonas]MCC4586298.1 outer membrane beta-barrel protein [Xanthomonas sp. NCPPB 1067]MCC4599853.1 outer membrane beta-barrel protein [Xanthomonas melonis]MCD0247166.1 OmpW family protein [Xanthomonas melonis]MCD0259639.1 OmpW family protein [Xanthomonas melonis]MCD0268216.1 OmpW family protein [Xanthomonas melonis]